MDWPISWNDVKKCLPSVVEFETSIESGDPLTAEDAAKLTAAIKAGGPIFYKIVSTQNTGALGPVAYLVEVGIAFMATFYIASIMEPITYMSMDGGVTWTVFTE